LHDSVHLHSDALATLAKPKLWSKRVRAHFSTTAARSIGKQLHPTLNRYLATEEIVDRLHSNLIFLELGRIVGRNLLQRMPELHNTFTAAWYQPLVMGVLHEMNAAGVSTIDIQHGQQGPFQSMFVGMPRSEEVTRSIAPTESWVWGSKTRDLMDSGHPSGGAIQIIGYPFLADTYVYRDLIKNGSGVPQTDVLISLQAPHLDSPEEVPLGLVNKLLAMGLSVQMRQHPNHRLSPTALNQIRREFSDSVIVSEPRLPFSVVVPSVGLNVSGFSSTTLEAASLGIPSLLWSPIAEAQYADLMASGVVAVSSDFREAIKYLSGQTRPDFSAVRAYIEPGDKLLLASIRKLDSQ